MASSIFHKDLLVVPPEAQYHPKGHSDDLIVSHRLKKVFPENTTPVGENSSIRFHIYGAGQHIDMNSVRLFFNVRRNTTAAEQTTNTGKEQLAKLASAPIRFQEWIGSLFRTVEIRLNNQTLISRIDYRNILHHITGIYTINEAWKQSSNGANEGYVNQLAYRNYLGELVPANSFQKAVLATHDQQYCIQFDLENIFTTQKYVPLDLVRSIDIELITEYNNRVLVRDFCQLGHNYNSQTSFSYPFITHGKGTAATDSNIELAGAAGIELSQYNSKSKSELITINDNLNGAGGYYSEEIGKGYLISDYYLTADFYQFSDSYRAQLEQTLLSTGIIFPMRGFINISEQLTPGTRHEIRIRRSLTSVKTLFLSFELDSLSTKGELEVNGSKQYFADPMSTFLRHNLKSYQVLLNGVPIQGHRIDTSYIAPGDAYGSTKNAEHILENNKAFKIHGNHVISGTSSAFTSKFQLVPIEVNDSVLLGELCFESANGVVYSSAAGLKTAQTDEKFVIGVNLEKCRTVSGSSMQEIVVLFEWEQSTPQNLQLMSFLYYDQHLEIRPGFDFILHE